MKQMVKRIVGCLSSMMILSSCIIPALASYPDVTLSSPDYAGIEYCQNKGIMSGFEDGLFHPEQEITRGMVATILYRMHGSPAVSGQGFSDVPSWSFYKDSSAWALQKGIMSGNLNPQGTRTFDGEDPVKRADLALIFYRLSGDSIQENLYHTAIDVSDQHYAYTAIRWALQKDVIQPINRNFESNLAATRGVTATLIYKYETRPGEEQNVQSPLQPAEKKLPAWFNGELQTFQIEQEDGSFVEKQGFHDSQVSALLLDATNEQRKLYGENCDPLKFNQILTDYANMRAVEISQKYLHSRPNGEMCHEELLEKEDWLMDFGENIVQVYDDYVTLSRQEAVDQGIEIWMNSPGHRANILDDNYTLGGMGFYCDVNKESGVVRYCMVQIFGTSIDDYQIIINVG